MRAVIALLNSRTPSYLHRSVREEISVPVPLTYNSVTRGQRSAPELLLERT